MASDPVFADVIVPLAVPARYTYRVPQDLAQQCKPGKRALVQFGKSKLYTGIVHTVHHKAPEAYEAKNIETLLDEEPVVTSLQLKFWDWVAFYYCAHPGEVMNAALPAGLKLQSTSVVSLDPSFNPEEDHDVTLSENESRLVQALHVSGPLGFSDLSQLLDLRAPQSLVTRLHRRGLVTVQESVQEKYHPKTEAFLKMKRTFSEEELHGLLDKLEKKAPRQAEALLLFLHLYRSGQTVDGWVARKDVLKTSDAGAIKSLIKKEILDEKHFETGRLLFEKRQSSVKQLSEEQESALGNIRKIIEAGKPALLHGVTGSGKTEVYIALIAEALKQEREVLMLIPEIALTTQLITRLRAAFGEKVGVYHSRFSENERVEIWNNVLSVKKGEKSYRVILGARSALFLPFQSLGLIIVDEEHDSSFKQHDPAPRYQARDAALYLASLHHAGVVLGSATPSLESYFNATEGRYGLVELQNQYVKGGGTSVEICDTLYYTNTNQMKASLTPPLFTALSEALARKAQAILFQNRRGFAPYTECRHCGHVPHCIQCDVSLIYHKQQEKLICHYCGYNIRPLSVCPACESNQLHFKGLGTEKIEEDIEILFPSAKIARMDLDSTRSKHAYRQLIDDFEAGNIDILVGTQMVTKGLDFRNVDVVGVLNADSLLNFPDFRSFERAWQLMSQVRGRAGRSDKRGKVFIQTTQVEHPVLAHVRTGNYEAFFRETMAERREFGYPPFTRLFVLKVIGREVNEVSHLAQELFNLLDVRFHGQLLGPEYPLISRIRNEYHKRILLKTPRSDSATDVRAHLHATLNALHESYRQWRFRVVIDVDPA